MEQESKHHLNLYDETYTLSLFTQQKLGHIQKLTRSIPSFKLTDFIKFTLQIIIVPQTERLYFTRGLIKLFQSICKSKNKQKITFLDLTSFIIDKVPRIHSENQIHQKLLPFNFQIDQDTRSKIPAPDLFGKNLHQIKRLQDKVIYHDKLRHFGRRLIKARYSPTCSRFFSLDSPAETIKQFNQNCQMLRNIKSELQLAKNQAVIISFDWSQSQKLLGCVLFNHSCSFWSFVDDYRFEINIPLNKKYLKTPPVYIYFMNSQSTWLTFDSKPNIYILDKEDFTIVDSIHHTKLCSGDNGFKVTEASYQKILCVAFQKTILLLSVNRKQILSEINSFKTDVRSFCFSDTYQSLFISCYQPYIYVYELSQFCDLNQKGHFNINKNLVTTINTIENSPILISVQEDGLVRLWDIRDMSCFQWLYAPKNTLYNQILVIDNGICLVGSKLITYKFESTIIKKQKEIIISIHYYREKLLVVTNKNINFYSIQTGKLIKVITALFQDDLIVFISVIESQDLLLVVNTKGLAKLVEIGDGTLIYEIQLSQGRPIYLNYQKQVKILCYATENIIQLYQFTVKLTLQLKRIIKMHQDQLYLVRSSCLHDLVTFTYGKNIIYFYSFEKGKSISSVIINSQIKDYKFLHQNKAIIVATKDSQIILIQYEMIEFKLVFKQRTRMSKIWQISQEIGEKSQQQSNKDNSQPVSKLQNQESLSESKIEDYIEIQNMIESQKIKNNLKAKQIFSEPFQIKRVWQYNKKIYVASSDGRIVILIFQEIKICLIQKQLEKQFYNPSRMNQQNHIESFKRIKHGIAIKSHNHNFKVVLKQQVHKSEIIDICIIDSLIVTSQQEGRIKFNDQILQTKGIINIKYSLPEQWVKVDDKMNNIKALQFANNLLITLKYLNPQLKQYLTTQSQSQIKKTVTNSENESNLKSKIEFKLKSLGNNTSPSKALHSLRSKKICIEKERQQRKNYENYLSMLQKKEAKHSNTKNHNEQQREIILFFDEKYTENITRRNINIQIQSPIVKDLNHKLTTMMKTQAYKSEMSEISTFNQKSSPVKLTEPKYIEHSISKYPKKKSTEFLQSLQKSASIAKYSNLDEKAKIKLKIKQLQQNLMDSKFRRKSNSLPKLKNK